MGYAIAWDDNKLTVGFVWADLALLLLRESMKHLSQVLFQLSVQRLPAPLWYEVE